MDIVTADYDTAEIAETSTMMPNIIQSAPTTVSTISPLLSLIINSTKTVMERTTSSTPLASSSTTTTTISPASSATIFPDKNMIISTSTSTSISTSASISALCGSNFSEISSKIMANLTNNNININNTNIGWSPQFFAVNNSSLNNYEAENKFIEHYERNEFRVPDLYNLPLPIYILMIIAIIFLSFMAISFFQALWKFFICHFLGYGAKWCPGPDSWAIVTGSTDGIGKAYAKAMAKKGYCVMLLSRNPQKLDKVKAEILSEFPDCPQIRTMAVDFCLDNIYKQIATEIHSLPGHVHVLINNVGMAYKYPEYFTKIPNLDKFISDILNCNILSVTRMTQIVLPMMEARRSGIILNIASFSALFPTPLLTMYSASKIYMDYFSRALHTEYKDRGIVVQSVLPYYVSTNMIRNPAVSFMVPSPDQFVNSALKTVGVEVRTYGYFAHNALAFLQSFVAKFIIGNSVNTKIAFRRMRRLRKGCYKRKGLKHNV